MNDVEEKVLETIKGGKAKMRPKWYFVLQAVLVAAVGVVLFLCLIFIVSFIIFALHESGAWFARDFGFSGWYLFLQSLPLILVFLSLLFALAIAIFAWRYAFIYHRPMLYLLVIIAGLPAVAGFLIIPASLHYAIINYAAEDHIPFINGFYELEESIPSAVHRGQIVSFLENGFILRDSDGETTTVILVPTSSFGMLGVGDPVVVFGNSDASRTIHPFGVKKIGL